MKGASALVVVILILMIGLSITGLGYITFTTLLAKATNSTEEAISSTISSMLAQMRIESVSKGSANEIIVYVRNIGKVDLTAFAAYINGTVATKNPSTPTGNKIAPGNVDNVTITAPLYRSGDTVKITTAQGALAIQAEP